MSGSAGPAAVTLADVRDALAGVVDPCSIATGVPLTLAEMGMVTDIAVDGGRVAVTLVLTSPVCWQAGNIIQAVEAAISRVPRVTAVRCTIDHDAGWLPGQMDPRARRRLRSVRPVPDPATGWPRPSA
jgi:metal-sulfur cluster biosynthetic enzyme